MSPLAPLTSALIAWVALAGTPAATARFPGALSAQEVKTQIVGHRVTTADANGSMSWAYFPDGHYEGGDERAAHNGRYTIEADGRLCWKEGPINGCFLYIRKGKNLILRRADPGHDFELGPVKVAPM